MTEKLPQTHPGTETGTQTAPLDSIPEDIESAGAKLVYLAVKVSDDPTTATLATKLQMKSLTLYPILRVLSERGHIESDGDTISCL